MPEISLVIVTYNSAENIGKLLDSIYKFKDNVKIEVFVIDNASNDESLTIARKHKIKAKCEQMGFNAGFSKAVNRVLKKALGEYILLLNPDTEITKGSLQELLGFARTTSLLGAVVPQLINPDGTAQASVFKFPTINNAIKRDFLGCKNCFGKYRPDNKIQQVEVAVMAAFLIPQKTIDIVGGLNEKYFLYYEDIDYCQRLKTHNLPIYYLPSVKIRHIHGASGGFVYHLKSPLLESSKLYYGDFYSKMLNVVLWLGHKWQVILRGHKFRD